MGEEVEDLRWVIQTLRDRIARAGRIETRASKNSQYALGYNRAYTKIMEILEGK